QKAVEQQVHPGEVAGGNDLERLVAITREQLDQRGAQADDECEDPVHAVGNVAARRVGRAQFPFPGLRGGWGRVSESRAERREYDGYQEQINEPTAARWRGAAPRQATRWPPRVSAATTYSPAWLRSMRPS